MSSNDTSLADLPIEMVHHVCTLLPKNDLLALRLASRYFASATVTELSTVLRERLSALDVLVTKAGLQVLCGLTQIPEFLREIEEISLIGNVQKLLRRQSVLVSQQILSEQKVFDESDELVELLSDCFRNLQKGEKLHTIKLGVRMRMGKTQQICGFRALKRRVTWNVIDINVFIDLLWPSLAKEAVFVPLRIMRDIQMKSMRGFRLAHLEIRLSDDDTTNDSTFDDSWEALSLLRQLKIASHKGTIHYEGRKWLEKCVQFASGVEFLTVEGCAVSPECAVCPSWYQNQRNLNVLRREKRCVAMRKGCKGCRALGQGLATSSFNHVRYLELRNLSVNGDVITRLLQPCKTTLERIKLKYIELTSGSWRPIFTFMIEQLPNLERVELMRLYQSMKSATSAQYGIDRRFLQTSGKPNVAQFLRLTVDSFMVNRLFQGHVTAEVQFPHTDDVLSMMCDDQRYRPTVHYDTAFSREELRDAGDEGGDCSEEEEEWSEEEGGHNGEEQEGGHNGEEQEGGCNGEEQEEESSKEENEEHERATPGC